MGEIRGFAAKEARKAWNTEKGPFRADDRCEPARFTPKANKCKKQRAFSGA
jgi:hypothetical protein